MSGLTVDMDAVGLYLYRDQTVGDPCQEIRQTSLPLLVCLGKGGELFEG